MTDPASGDRRWLTRRRLLRSVGGALGAAGLWSVAAGADEADDSDDHDHSDCPETTLRPSMVHYDDSVHEVCRDDHPDTRALQEAVTEALEEEYPTVGSLVDSGFIPYFDFFADGDWSHWIKPEFIGDDSVVDASRPESVLVDHTYWRPIGVMFVATKEGEEVDPPPAVYEADGRDTRACVPWHAHVGLPGRYAWWKYQTVYGDGADEFPCRTPWMMHMWRYDHPKSLYAHGAPRERGGPPAEEPGFETDADPDEEELGPEHLPDAFRERIEEVWE